MESVVLLRRPISGISFYVLHGAYINIRVSSIIPSSPPPPPQANGESYFTEGVILSSAILELSQTIRQYHQVGRAHWCGHSPGAGVGWATQQVSICIWSSTWECTTENLSVQTSFATTFQISLRIMHQMWTFCESMPNNCTRISVLPSNFPKTVLPPPLSTCRPCYCVQFVCAYISCI